MKSNIENLIDNIEHKLQEEGKNNFGKLYVGITGNIKRRLSEHRVSEDDWHYHIRIGNIHLARAVESHFLDKGMQGGRSGGNENSTILYFYETNRDTEEY